MKRISSKQLESIEARGGKVVRPQKPVAEESAEQQAMAKVVEQSTQAMQATNALADKISESLALNTEQSAKLFTMLQEGLLAIEKERNRDKRIVFNREKSGDRLIESADIITLK